MKRLLVNPTLVLLVLLVWTPALSADFQKGIDAVQKGDHATALKEWKPLAEQGDARAQFRLGQMYHRERGVPRDYKIAVKWYILASEQGHIQAQTNLGVMLTTGRGVGKSKTGAYKWWSIAASQGHKKAEELRDMIKKRMTLGQITEAKRIIEEWKKNRKK